MFSSNFADFGAAIFSIYNSHVIFKDTSTITFTNNTAHYCGALIFAMFSTVTYTDHTKVTYQRRRKQNKVGGLGVYPRKILKN